MSKTHQEMLAPVVQERGATPSRAAPRTDPVRTRTRDLATGGDLVSAAPQRLCGIPEAHVQALHTSLGNRAVGFMLADRRAAPGSAEVHAAAVRGTRGPGAALPHREALQRAFGRHDLGDVRAHLGPDARDAAQAMGASAFASGSRIAFAAAPDLRTAAHEAAHVVQQRGGLGLDGGVGRVGDVHERHADAVAEQVVRGRSAEALLDRYAPVSTPASAPAVQRVINTTVDRTSLTGLLATDADDMTYALQVKEVAKTAAGVNLWIPQYDQLDLTTELGKANALKALKNINIKLGEMQGALDWLIPGLSLRNHQSGADAKTYAALVTFQTSLMGLIRATNNETARVLNITRAGAGNRPDANTEGAIGRSVANLGLTQTETTWMSDFATNQGNSWKEQREALSGIWAKRGGQFTNLTAGKETDEDGKVTLDVEYKTTDQGKSTYWDQKTIFTGQEAFDGRIKHTHTKHTDDNDRGVGLLFDSTFENESNYEKAWLTINAAILGGDIDASAVREVKAANPALFSSDVYVDVTSNSTANGFETNVKWVEKQLSGQQNGGYETIASAKLSGTNYAKLMAGQLTSHSRYTNNRNWLPDGVYDEYAVTGLPNDGAGRFVANADRSVVYLSVTHYKPYTVKPANANAINRRAFFRVV